MSRLFPQARIGGARAPIADPAHRRGAIAPLAAILLSVLFAFVAYGIDSSRIVSERTKMQNAVDAASLAASQEIVAQVREAGRNVDDGQVHVVSIAENQARAIAAEVAAANGVHVDPNLDVFFGKRFWDEDSEEWRIDWGVEPYNVVKVVARRDNPDLDRPDGAFPLAFGWAVGSESTELVVSASAFIEARDMVLVLDFSASMNDDSSIGAFSKLGQANVEASLDAMWNALVSQRPVWPGTDQPKFPATGFGLVNSHFGTYQSGNDSLQIVRALGLDQVDEFGNPVHPFPQSGRNNVGFQNPRPTAAQSTSLWRGYVDHVRQLSGSYNRRFGYRTLMNYLQESRFGSNQSEDLWRTPHYPFHAVKEGSSLLCDFLEELDFGDQLGLVSYGTYAMQEKKLIDGLVNIDLSADPITENYSLIDTIQRHKQAGHYAGNTGMGDGVLKAHELLFGRLDDTSDQGHVRFGARPTLILMTDGQTNQSPGGWSLPNGFRWADWTDYDGDGSANYSTADRHKQYAFWEATRAIRNGVTIHTMSVGAGADRSLMKAIAFAGGGVWIDVPGGRSVHDMEREMLEAFSQIAAKVPPPKIIYDDTPMSDETAGDGSQSVGQTPYNYDPLGDLNEKGNNGVGNGIDPAPPGEPPLNDGEGTGPGSPGNQGGV